MCSMNFEFVFGNFYLLILAHNAYGKYNCKEKCQIVAFNDW